MAVILENLPPDYHYPGLERQARVLGLFPWQGEVTQAGNRALSHFCVDGFQMAAQLDR